MSGFGLLAGRVRLCGVCATSSPVGHWANPSMAATSIKTMVPGKNDLRISSASCSHNSSLCSLFAGQNIGLRCRLLHVQVGEDLHSIVETINDVDVIVRHAHAQRLPKLTFGGSNGAEVHE